jgi:hypothetical protein
MRCVRCFPHRHDWLHSELENEKHTMSTTTLIVVILLALLVFGGGGGYYWSRRG